VNEQFFDDDKEKSQGLNLDFKRVLSRAIRFWYVIVISLGIAVAAAFYLTRYSERVYTVFASIIIREMQETGGAEILYKNALIDPYRNYLNEPYIIRSYPLIEKVVRNLNFHTVFYREGYFMTTEAYNYVPVKAELDLSKDSLGAPSGQFIFELRDEGHFTLKKFSKEEKPDVGLAYPLGQQIEFEGLNFKFTPIKGRELKEFIGVPFLLVIENPTAITARYISRLNVEWAEEGAGIINLSVVGTNPEKEIDFLNALIAEYRNIDLSKKNEAAERTIEFIKNQISTIKDSLRTVEYQLERFGNNSRVKDMSADAQRLLEKAEGFELQKSELLIRQRYFQYLVDYLSKDEGNLDQIILPSSVGLTDPVLTSLISKMIDLQLEIKMNLGTERAKNPLITNKLERIGSIKKDVDEAVRTLRSTDKIKMDFINGQLREAEKLLSNLPASERQLISVQRNYALLENLYVFLMQKLSEAGISKASSTSDIIPVNPPMRGGAIHPKPTQNYALALLAGFALPLAFFVFFELMNNKVQSKEDIEKITDIPFVGGVGHKISANNLIVNEKPKSGVAESFRALRSNLNYFTANKTQQVFMVTSSISGEGKTFTTINLATVFALSGRKTLIVGADMRRPKIFDDFMCANEFGLSTYLSGLSDFESIVQQTSVPNLYLVSGGPVPPNPSELLLTESFETFIKKSLERFDFVLLDTPPLALVTDAFVMSKFADHTVFVMRQNYSPKEFVKSINEFYKSGKLNKMSILLNDIHKSGLGYGYGHGYTYHYGYSYGYALGRKKEEVNGYYDEN
jgi:capsular exopolysaccharide synthesis family protein